METHSQKDNTEWSGEVYTVSEFNQLVQKNLELAFPMIALSGELCSLYLAQSGHLYGALKDQNSQIRFVCYQGVRKHISFELRDGLEVLLLGESSLYRPKGEFQFLVKKIEPLGIGALKIAFEQLKEKLQKEGLFDLSKKQSLPAYPKRIAVITSPDGAVWHDILKVIQRRFPKMPVTLYPTSVQGPQAPSEICAALKQAALENIASIYILARGGGSLSDLMAFNHEDVVRAVGSFPFPIISAIGHETDLTLCDLAADVRAATPSIAAELATPHHEDILKHLKRFEERLQKNIHHLLRLSEHKIDKIDFMLRERNILLSPLLQKLKDYFFLMQKKLIHVLGISEKKILEKEKKILEKLHTHSYQHISEKEKYLYRLHEQASRTLDKKFYRSQNRLNDLEKKFFQLNPSLKGSAIRIENSEGALIQSAFQIEKGDKGQIQFADGIWEIVFMHRQSE